MLNVLVVSKDCKTPGGIEWAPSHHVLYCPSRGWATAANTLLARAAESGGDALFLDDDTCLTKDSLASVYAHYDAADLFGLDLHDMNGERQIGARHVMGAGAILSDWVHPGPAYVAHVSTSAIYLKASALSLRFPEWPGVHWEDVAFCLDAWLHGLRVLAVPGYVHHGIVGGVGATKRHDGDFWGKWARNMAHFGAWCGEKHVSAALAQGVIPMGAQPIEEGGLHGR